VREKSAVNSHCVAHIGLAVAAVTSMGEGCVLDRTTIAAVLIDQYRATATCFLSASCDWL